MSSSNQIQIHSNLTSSVKKRKTPIKKYFFCEYKSNIGLGIWSNDFLWFYLVKYWVKLFLGQNQFGNKIAYRKFVRKNFQKIWNLDFNEIWTNSSWPVLGFSRLVEAITSVNYRINFEMKYFVSVFQ